MSKPKAIFSPVKTRRTFEEVSQRIKGLIFEGLLRPGDKLPSENEMAKTFRVGRQSVREALRLLELTGFIYIQRGVKGGPIIENTMLAKIGHMFVDAFKFNRISITDMTQARIEIEKSVLKLVFENIDHQDISALKANIQQAKAKLSQGVLAFEENVEFHRLLTKASRNHVFMVVMEPLLTILSDFRSRLANVGIDRSKSVTQAHEDMLNAIIAKDHERAEALLVEHLLEVREICSGDTSG